MSYVSSWLRKGAGKGSPYSMDSEVESTLIGSILNTPLDVLILDLVAQGQ